MCVHVHSTGGLSEFMENRIQLGNTLSSKTSSLTTYKIALRRHQPPSSYLRHVGKCEVVAGVPLVFLDDVEEDLLPLQGHFEPGVVPIVVVEGEGQNESFCVREVFV